MVMPPPPVGCGVDRGGAHRIHCGRIPLMVMLPPPPPWDVGCRCTSNPACIYAYMPCMHLPACICNACICRCGRVGAYSRAYEYICMHMHTYACVACIFHSLGDPISPPPNPCVGGGSMNPGPQDIYINMYICIYICILIIIIIIITIILIVILMILMILMILVINNLNQISHMNSVITNANN